MLHLSRAGRPRSGPGTSFGGNAQNCVLKIDSYRYHRITPRLGWLARDLCERRLEPVHMAQVRHGNTLMWIPSGLPTILELRGSL
jgi:hypothetical protein